jgi:hypothetical protein
MAAEEAKSQTVAYVPFRTFLTALDGLSHGLPHVIDRSIFPQMSGVTQSQLMGALKFLKLISAEGKPTAALHALAVQKDKRAENLKAVLEDAYPELIQSDLSKATPSSLNAAFEKFGLTGETNVKAKSFFLQAAKTAGIVLSPYLLKGTRTVSKRKKPLGQSRGAEVAGTSASRFDDLEDYEFVSPGVNKVIRLDNGSTLSLTLDKNFGELPSRQRKFVNEVIDMMEAFVERSMAEDEAIFEALEQPKVSP